jgi:hypothetical protein
LILLVALQGSTQVFIQVSRVLGRLPPQLLAVLAQSLRLLFGLLLGFGGLLLCPFAIRTATPSQGRQNPGTAQTGALSSHKLSCDSIRWP